MLYYIKDLKSDKRSPRMAFDQLWRFLDFRDLVYHSENRKALLDWLAVNPPGAPDLVAAVLAHLQYRGWLDTEEVVNTGLRYCRTMIEDAGFDETALYKIKDEAQRDLNYVMLVFGCQGHTVRDARARAAFHVVKRAPAIPFTVVFSGRNPSENAERLVRVKNEARALEREFSRLVDQDLEMAQRHNFHIARMEEESSSTVENLANFLKGNYLKKGVETHLFLVSSTFHLPRIAAGAERLIAGDLEIQETVNRLFLVGGETNVAEDPITKEAPYVKAMFYEVFEHVFKHRPFEVMRPSQYEGAV